MKKTAIIQARMSSTRLPGKVMKTLIDRPLIEHVISRVKAAKQVDEIVLATTIEEKDDVLVNEAETMQIPWFRGSRDDVLSRYYHAAKESNADIIIRITSDCPVIDPEVIDKMLDIFIKEKNSGNNIDYISNTLSRTFPRGLDVEVFTFDALKKTYRKATQTYEREHVTPYIYHNPDKFALRNYSNDTDLSEYRLTVDTYEDFILIEDIYKALYKRTKIFLLDDIVNFLGSNPRIAEINKNIVQKKLGE